MVLRQLQDLLAGIYDLPVAYDVYDFVFTDRRFLPAGARDARSDEQLLVRQDGEEAALGLFLSADLLQRLNACNPIRALNAANLSDYWTALEGVSHFLYLAWNAAHDRAVSLLELEMQAEVDKYIASVWLLWAQDPARYPSELHRLLFTRCRVDAVLAGDRQQLYREASQYAARFCRRLEQGLRARRLPAQADALRELRQFYRLSRERKVSHIRRHA
jgi:hypothetical protein